MDQHTSFSIDTFCARNEFSRGFYYKLKRTGRGPREMRVDGLIRITAEAEREWQKAREAATAEQQQEPTAA
jgi:hypothetical protein